MKLGAGKGDAAFGFEVSDSNSFGDSGISSKTVEGNQMSSSGGSVSIDLGINIRLLCIKMSES